MVTNTKRSYRKDGGGAGRGEYEVEYIKVITQVVCSVRLDIFTGYYIFTSLAFFCLFTSLPYIRVIQRLVKIYSCTKRLSV